ncbi:MAG: hypothetical protein IJ138_04345, partial [Clostridia bacterium]|nr:hypothetical protein [Clostridia bacterium]
ASALQGLVPALNLSFSGGAPFAESTLYLRGLVSTGKADPLVLVDGVEVGRAPMEITWYGEWHTGTVTDIAVTEGQTITVGIRVKCTGDGNGAWGKIDDAMLNSQTEAAEHINSNEIETTQLFKDFFEPYMDSVGKLTSTGFSTVEKLQNYKVEYKEGNEKDLCTYSIYADNGDYVYMMFYPVNVNDKAEEWIETLSTLAYESGGKEISIGDNFHTGNKLSYSTHDPNREKKNIEVDGVEQLIGFMFAK